jgi:hypothetical protein
MAARRRFVLFELNEVPLRVVRHFAGRHARSAFAKILETGRRWDTMTPDQGHLSPWVTWPTLHRGVASSEHHLLALGQDTIDADRHFPPVWTLLARAGKRVGLFGSLHSYPLPSDLANFEFYVPDTFAAGPETKPPELSAFQRFNLRMVDRSGRNVSSELPIKEALDFLVRSLPAGVRPSTLAKIALQVTSERIWKHRTARRRTIQSLLAFDLFRGQLHSRKPHAAFFFTNHVASSMHRYWPATFTDDYRVTNWNGSWVRRFSGELDYAMGEADQMLGEMMAFADRNPDYLILVSGSMGQAAVDEPGRQVGSEVLLRDLGRFLGQLGVKGGWERRRTMEPTYTVVFDEADVADRFIERVATVKIAGGLIKHRRLEDRGVEFVLGQPNVPDEELTVTIGNRSMAPDEAGIANVRIDDEVGAAAYHVPEGMLLVYDPRRDWAGETGKRPVSTTRIAPTLLALLDVELPPYMEPVLEELVSAEMEMA